MAKRRKKRAFAEADHKKFFPLSVTKFGIAGGITWALGVLLLGLLGTYGVKTPLIGAIGTLYIGYSATILGSIIGAIWAFIDGFIGCAIFAWIYNKLR